MQTPIFAICSFLVIIAGAYEARAQEAGDAAKGLHYVSQVCAQCHAVRKGDNVSPNPLAPSFESIANAEGVTGISLAATLHSVHENMPNFVLRPDVRDHVIAYILSLKHER